jgi:hypothetical protein
MRYDKTKAFNGYILASYQCCNKKSAHPSSIRSSARAPLQKNLLFSSPTHGQCIHKKVPRLHACHLSCSYIYQFTPLVSPIYAKNAHFLGQCSLYISICFAAKKLSPPQLFSLLPPIRGSSPIWGSPSSRIREDPALPFSFWEYARAPLLF